MSKKRLKDVRVVLPKGLYYDVLTAGAKLHGAPSLSKYILNAAMTYTQTYLQEKKDELDKRKEEASNLRNSTGNDDRGTDPVERQDPGISDRSGSIPSVGESGSES